MRSRRRRDFLKLCAGSVPALALRHLAKAEAAFGPDPAQTGFRSPSKIDRFIDPLATPKRLRPETQEKDQDHYRVRMLEFSKQLHSQLPPTRLWGYEGQYPGPTIEAQTGRPVTVFWQNRLPAKHLLPIDLSLHGAMPPAPAVRTVPHLHGSRTHSSSDGMPEAWFVPGGGAKYEYPNAQSPATLWYHDHAMGITRLNVYAGLSAFYLLRDERELAMGLPSGDYEIPLILQDRSLTEQGQLYYGPTHEDGTELPQGLWGPMVFGRLPVVNGGIFPYKDVEPSRYRLRLLNGSNSRFYNLSFNLAKGPTDIPRLHPFHQIGSDGGFLAAPVQLQSLLLAPGERADVIVDFNGLDGKVATLSNVAATPYPGWAMMTAPYAPLYELVQFRVSRPLAPQARAFSMPPEKPLVMIEESASVRTRDFVLTEILDAKKQSLGVRINGKRYADPATEIVKLGSVETWRFINTTDDTHPMHLHLVQFQVVERQGYDMPEYTKGNLKLLGKPRKPEANEAGWKDTAIVNPGEVLTIRVRFDGYTGWYVFHCHMLEHEDNDMMRPYQVVPA